MTINYIVTSGETISTHEKSTVDSIGTLHCHVLEYKVRNLKLELE